MPPHCPWDRVQKNDADKTTELEGLQQWYELNKPNTHLSSFDDMKPLWGAVYMTEPSSELAIYEVSLSNPNKVYQKVSDANQPNNGILRNNIRLLLFKDKATGQIIAGCYMSILNEGKISLDLNGLHYKQAQHLNGKIMFFNLSGKLENGWEYQDGRITKRINGSLEGYYHGTKSELRDLKNPAIGVTGSRFDKLMTYMPPPCVLDQPDWRTTCVGVDGYMECTTYLAGYTCVDQTPGGGGEGGYNPYPSNPGHGGGGGNGGSNSPPNTANLAIIDSLVGYPCAQDILRQLPNLKNDIATLIKNTFGPNSNIDLQFKVDSTLKNTTVDGKFLSYAGNSPNNGATYKIGINPDVLKNASREYILVTLYHEALHAYIGYAKATMSADLFTATFGSLEFNGGRTLLKPVDGHFELAANNYILGLRNSIISLNASYNLDRAYALALGGIVNLSTSDFQINSQERDTSKIGYTGTKCP